MIRYKVVTPNRKSYIASKLKHYSLEYQKGKIVVSKENTFGIFCFKSYKQAENFCECFPDDNLILEVRPIGKGFEPSKVSCMNNSREVKMFYNHLEKKKDHKESYLDYLFLFPPPGTVCYQKVKVLT